MKGIGAAVVAMIVCVSGILAPAHADTNKACVLRAKSVLDITFDEHGRPVVPATIDGLPARMLVDTGTALTIMESIRKDDPYAELNLSLARGVKMLGGSSVNMVITLREFVLGQLRRENATLAFVGRFAAEAYGLLGADVLSNYDLDFDFGKGKLTLIVPHRCKGDTVYWTKQAYGVVPFSQEKGHIVVKALLDGREITAVVDTGASGTIMSLDTAVEVFGLDRAALSSSRKYPFKALGLGEVSIGNPEIALIPDEESKLLGRKAAGPDMIIGMGVLRRLHLYIAYEEETIYVTPATQY